MLNSIVILGAPVPCARPRRSGHFMYDSQMQAKENFAFKAKEAIGIDFRPLESVFLVVRYDMPIPKSFSNRKRLNTIGEHHKGRPDLSNLIKFTEDALNGILWKDDAHIYGMLAKKVYSEEPKTTIWAFEEPEWQKVAHEFNSFSTHGCSQWRALPIC